MNELSIQELRQALRERGANSRGSKKQLMQRMAEQYGFPSSPDTPAVAKVRVTVQKSRHQQAMLLMDPSLSPEHLIRELLTKATNKFKFRPTHLYVVANENSGTNGSVELTSENIRSYLKDGLIVLASNLNKLFASSSATQLPSATSSSPTSLEAPLQDDPSHIHVTLEPHQNSQHEEELSTSLEHKEFTTDSGSCSSAEMDEIAETHSLKSFDSDSLYSYQSAAPIRSAARSPIGIDENKEDQHQHQYQHASQSRSHSRNNNTHSSSNPSKKKGWKSWLPQAADQIQQQQQRPSSPTLKLPVPSSAPPSAPASTHQHRNHRCSLAATSATTSSAAATATSTVDSSSSSSSIATSVIATSTAHAPSSSMARLPSLMDEIASSSTSASSTPVSVPCPCCEAGCEIDFATASTNPMPRTPSHNNLLLHSHSTPSSPSPPPSALQLTSSSSVVAPTPLVPPQLSHSNSHSNLTLDQLRIAELEKTNRRLDSSLKNYLKSDLELRARVATLSAGANIAVGLEDEFRTLKLQLEIKDKDIAKLNWERDRLKTKNRTLMEKNNELKSDSEALISLKKDHAALQQSFARLNGHNINSQTSAHVLNELLLLHTEAIQRVNQQMSQNLAREKKELTEARLCKVCLAKPSDTILLPCSHYVLCGHCASSLVKCPICRTQISDKRPVYM